ncbi:hypothetical protein VIGAN_04130500 [Vigna angularis var. angularis]|uniref:Pentatricopeptide repeat-containing protein n=1 Tax=Vigna angularis var. angularis TaxID=157739 RepID=A0A0S3RTZ5_PHAAN|nr:hypothetical protein VIGAN_04130500 [Vigna angularis var. angularis]
MIAGYSKIGHCSGAVMLLEEMQHQGVQPDVFTFVSLLSVSSKNDACEECGFLEFNNLVPCSRRALHGSYGTFPQNVYFRCDS